MYTLKINDDGTVTTTVYETIMEKSNYVDSIQIITDKKYKEQIDMTDAILNMKYVMPISKQIKLIKLTPVDLNYKQNYIQYKIPANAYFTAECGSVEVTFTFTKVVVNTDGTYTSYVRKTEPGIIRITPLAQFDKYEPDGMLSEIDQRLLKLEALQKDILTLNQNTYDEMINDIRINPDLHKLTLVNKKGDTGTGVNISDLATSITTDLTGLDPDKVQDGVTHLDGLEGLAMVNLDNLLK